MPSALLSLILFAPLSLAHMELKWPYALRSKYNPATPQNLIDYNMKSPLDSDGSNFPCKGYQNDATDPVTTYNAGSTYNISLDGSAMHLGGSCQLSLSYDGAKTFKVIRSLIGGCPLTSTYDFTVPSNAPAGRALLAWTWQNKEGNREYYMNCAAVEVTSSVSSISKRAAFNQFSNLWVANLHSINSCTTSEGEDPVYPSPGPDVTYGDGMSASSPVSPGICEVPSRLGSTGQQGNVSALPEPQSTSTITPTSYSEMDMSMSTAYLSTSTFGNFTASTTLTTVTVTIDCPASTVSTSASDYTTAIPSAACTGTSAICPCAPNYACMAIGSCTWACMATTTSSMPFFTTYTVPPSTPAATTSNPPAPTMDDLAYVPDDPNQYLPCQPGTFLCASRTSFWTCGQFVASTDYVWTYGALRDTADGMMCQPSLSSGGTTGGQQPGMPQGYYRDDLYVRDPQYS